MGRIGAWAEMATAAGLASVHFTNVAGHEPLVAPHGGCDARLGTNPFTMGFPSAMPAGWGGGQDVILDMATSKIALGKASGGRDKYTFIIFYGTPSDFASFVLPKKLMRNLILR